ncbi:MAG: response regulator transcription factor [Acidobacteria bacterium]|nr:response regulator transcription factor [Acidobacteriota bacterium]
MHRILIIEDEADIAENLRYNLKREGYLPDVAESGELGLKLALDENKPPSLILLDVMLPGMSGFELCRRLRREPLTEKTPIIMMTAKAAEKDKIAGLETGADDYVTKPFAVRELLARIRALLRRTTERSFEVYEDDRIRIDVGEMRVFCDRKKIELTRKEFALLVYLVKNTGRVPGRQQILDNVWGYSYYGDSRTLDVHIRRLRQKLGSGGDCIETVVGIGYRFIPCKS